MPANLENTAVATGLEKVSFHSNPKERQCQRMFKLPHKCTHLTQQRSNAQRKQSQRIPEKTSTSASLTMPKPLTVWIITNCGKFFKRWEYQTTLPASYETCTQVKKNSQNWIWINRLVPNRERSTSRLYIVTRLFKLYAEYFMRKAGLEEAQAGIKIASRNINNLNMQMTPPLWQKVKRNSKAS